MQRTLMQVNGRDYALAQNQDIDAVKARVVDAVRVQGDLVAVTLVGNTSLDVLVTPSVSITFLTEEVPADARDDGNLEAPFIPYDARYDEL
jgi:hypothetical protein